MFASDACQLWTRPSSKVLRVVKGISNEFMFICQCGESWKCTICYCPTYWVRPISKGMRGIGCIRNMLMCIVHMKCGESRKCSYMLFFSFGTHLLLSIGFRVFVALVRFYSFGRARSGVIFSADRRFLFSGFESDVGLKYISTVSPRLLRPCLQRDCIQV